ncbi:hypothetical protein R6Q57_025925 [Mikania cordata]
MDAGSNKRKKKRGKSLIFSKWFWLFWSSDDNKILASDDNLVYRDDTGNAVNGDAISKTKSSSSYGGRMSSIFKAVLFDTVMKKIRFMKTSENKIEPMTESTTELNTESTTELDTESTIELDTESMNELDTESTNGSNTESTTELNTESTTELNTESTTGLADEETNIKWFDKDDDQILVTTLKIDNNCTINTSSVASSSPKTKTPMVVSSGVDARSQLSNERKVMSRVNSTKKKPPLPSGPKSSIKTIPKRNNKPTTLNNSTSHLCVLVIVAAFVSVVLWMSFTSNVTESLDLDSDLKIVDVGNEL